MSEPNNAPDVGPHPGTNHQPDVHCRLCGKPMFLNVALVTNDEVVRIEPYPSLDENALSQRPPLSNETAEGL